MSIMRDDLLGENMKDCAVKAVKKHQANKTLSAGSVSALFFPLLNRTFKSPSIEGLFFACRVQG
ncbi:hypothetical protein [Xenorhabdus anantnagensis]|uniref:Uncharacterized protein n=1 Tax=Xenorhabdus anantnagensis TaxID=3025875 RepID=A0ABT5LRX7_9GAMM|nr:hypothetical protein [Xenorhabdus anantnagensis]MDC9597070.1 hypothetical protein [Xenorhabdus anantnagensis]